MVVDFTHLSPDFAVSGQIRPEQMPEIAAAGFRALINNRPDGEADDQPSSKLLETEARRCGLAYEYIPVVPGQASETDASAFARALSSAEGPVLAFCRTGSRSASLWKLSQQPH